MIDVEGAELSPADRRRLHSPSVGSVILFSRNFENKEQLRALIQEIKSLRHPHLLIAVDHEGGRVQRFRDGFVSIPPASVFESVSSSDQCADSARYAGMLMAAELIDVGVDFSFAPVLDHGDVTSSVIGNRSFSSDTDKVVRIAGAFVDGMNEAGMQATGKHFPGHGGVTGDSHFETPRDDRTLTALWQQDLVPFRKLKNKLAAVMTAHVHYPAVADDLPTYSPKWLQTVLRQDIGFRGLVFSDDLIMKGAEVAGDIVNRTRLALNAGCDVALICNDHESAELALEQIEYWNPQSAARLEAMRAVPAIPWSDDRIASGRETLSRLVNSEVAVTA